MHKYRNLLAGLLLVIPILTSAQGRTFGCIVNNELSKIKTAPDFNGMGAESPPDIYSLKRYCPTPGDQGQIGSCTAWTMGYGVLTIKYAINNNLTSTEEITNAAFSSMFIYNNIKNTQCHPNSADICNSCGSNFLNGLEFLKQYGDIPHAQINDGICNNYITNNMYSVAANNKIVSGSTLFYNNNTTDNNNIQRIIEQLYNNNPVFTSISLPSAYNNRTYFDIDSYFINGLWQPPYNATPNIANSHAVTIVGYNRNEQYFEILNSWGTDWADRGFCKISFNDYLKYATYAGVMFTAPGRTVTNPATALSLSLDKFVRVNGKTQPEGTNIPVTFNGSYYEAKAGQGQLFKINVTRLPQNYYAYVMSVDNDGSSSVHFPRNNQNPYIYKNNLGYKIPQTSVLVFNKQADNLIILLSKNEIPDFETKFTTAVNRSGTLYNNISNSFNAAAGNDIHFVGNSLSVQISGDNQENILLFVNIKRS